ncbi:MAG: chorismate synthase [Candidatus Omnitrophota bacterium]|nr:MAG: chorismate synthase [Candidatus Omnitrophota bacterium]
MRILTAGESHGECICAVLEGFPKGVKLSEDFINEELKRRMSGVGRGRRMAIEEDKVEIISGLRNKVTLGSPIAMLVKNRDRKIFSQKKDNLASLSVPRPSHADLAGAFKYQESDVRNILERSSARETVARVCAGAVCKQFLNNFNIRIASFTVSVAKASSTRKPKDTAEIRSKTKSSKLNCIDREAERTMIAQIRKAECDKDSLGGIVEVWIEGLIPGVGSFMHFDKRLDARIAYYLMSIPAIKGVENGLGFEYAKRKGTSTHDAIFYTPGRGVYRKTNNCGGIEGGMSNGEVIIFRAAMKPIATLRKPLDSVNLTSGKAEKAIVERSDTSAIAACGVIAESMAAIAVQELFLDKFGQDTLGEIKANYQSYLKTVKQKLKRRK